MSALDCWLSWTSEVAAPPPLSDCCMATDVTAAFGAFDLNCGALDLKRFGAQLMASCSTFYVLHKQRLQTPQANTGYCSCKASAHEMCCIVLLANPWCIPETKMTSTVATDCTGGQTADMTSWFPRTHERCAWSIGWCKYHCENYLQKSKCNKKHGSHWRHG